MTRIIVNGLLTIKRKIQSAFKDIYQVYLDYKISKQKKIALDVMKRLSSLNPEVLLAGGAPRDWFLDKPAVDLDVYLQHHDTDKVIDALPYLGLKLHKIKSSHLLDNYAKAWYLKDVLEIKYKNQMIQLMIISEPTSCVLEEFPLNISRASMNKHGKFFYSKEFIDGYIKRELVNELSYRYPDDHPYIMKIRSRFPDWKYINAPWPIEF